MKREFDLCLGTLAALGLCLPIPIIAILVRLTSREPALYWSVSVQPYHRSGW